MRRATKGHGEWGHGDDDKNEPNQKKEELHGRMEISKMEKFNLSITTILMEMRT